VGRGVDGSGHHAVGQPLVDHHRAEVGRVGHDRFRHVRRHALVLAQLEIGRHEIAEMRRLDRLDDVDAGQVEAQVRDLVADLLLVAEQDDVGDAAQQHLLRRVEDAVFLAFGQNDALAGRLRALDEAEFEHLGCDHARLGRLEEIDELLRVHVRLEQRQRGGDLAGRPGIDARMQPGHRRDRLEGRGRHGQDRHHVLDLLEERADRAGGLEAVRQHDAGDVDGLGGVELEHHAQQIAEAVARNEQQRAVAQLREEDFRRGIRHAVGRRLEGVEQVGTVERLGAEGLGDLGHHRRGQERVLRNREHGQIRIARRPQERRQLVDAVGREAVQDGRQHLAVAVLEALHREIEVGHLAVLADLVAVHHQQHRRVDVARDLGVDVEFEGGRVAFEVGPLADDEIVAGGHGVVFCQDAVEQGGSLAGADQFARLAAGVGERLLVGQVEPEVAGDQRDVVVRFRPAPIARDDRPEEADVADLLDHHFHHAQRDGGFAAAGFRRGNIHVAGHGLTFPNRRPGTRGLNWAAS